MLPYFAPISGILALLQGEVTVRFVETVAPDHVAEIVTVVAAATAPAVMEKACRYAPAGIVMDAGTEAADGFELDSFTTAPPGGATPLRTTRLPVLTD